MDALTYSIDLLNDSGERIGGSAYVPHPTHTGSSAQASWDSPRGTVVAVRVEWADRSITVDGFGRDWLAVGLYPSTLHRLATRKGARRSLRQVVAAGRRFMLQARREAL